LLINSKKKKSHGKSYCKNNLVEPVTHDVNDLQFKKPEGFNIHDRQIEVSVILLHSKKATFTFTSLNDSKHLEFTIKIDNHKRVTKIRKIKSTNLSFRMFSALNTKGEGVFIAGGAGVTPFSCNFWESG
jgi:ferredoxin-NADP reductase